MTGIADTSVSQLSLLVDNHLVPLFFQLLGHGFKVKVQTGQSVKGTLCNQLGIHEDYLAQRIKTIFLNAKVVDDVDSAIVPKDATMALSGAMPGLVGAIMRSGGFYAPMRRQISHNKNMAASDPETAQVTLKLWNLVVKELGPTFLERGVRIDGAEMRSFFERHLETLKTGCKAVELDGKQASIDQFMDFTHDADPVFLKVIPGEES